MARDVDHNLHRDKPPTRASDRAPAGSSAERFKAEAWPHLPTLLRVARILTRDVHQAEDLVQEAMLRAFSHVESYQPGTNMRAWLLTILRRAHIDQHRRDSRRISPVSIDAMGAEPADSAAEVEPEDQDAWHDPDALLERFDDQDIEQALRELPDGMRWVLLLVDVHQMSVAEAAEVLGVAEGTIKSRASRARAQLREKLLPVARRRGWVATPARE